VWRYPRATNRPAQLKAFPAPNSPADAVRNPAQVSFWLLEPVADAAMTYFYAQLFAMDTEIRAMFPAAMIEAAKATWADRDVYISGSGHMIVKTARVLRGRGGTRTCTTCPRCGSTT
jgi:hypothetical protein